MKAEIFYSSIYSISSETNREPDLVRFNNSRVALLDKDNLSLKRLILSNQKTKKVLGFYVNKKNHIVKIRSTNQADAFPEKADLKLNSDYRPSIVANQSEALKLFKGMRRDFRRNGECFNRAHVWAYEEYMKSGLLSMKNFIFFTDRYIRKYKYHWWFHVTPMVYVGGIKYPRTLDRRYSKGPLRTKTWSDIFIKSKLRCPVVKLYDDFWNNQKRQDCYQMQVSMFYVTPRDIERRDLTGEEKNEFISRELYRAYKDGFGLTIQLPDFFNMNNI